MLHGDLSDAVPQRLLFIFEGLIGRLPDKRAERRASAMLTLHQYGRAVDAYEIDGYTRSWLWDVWTRRDFRFDIVTLNGEGFAAALRRKLDQLDLPFGHVQYYGTVQDLALDLSKMPNVVEVVHANSDWMLAFGPKGHYVKHPREHPL